MIKQVELKTVKELYHVSKKYWETNDKDFLDKDLDLSEEIDHWLWAEVTAVFSLAVLRNITLETLIVILGLYGYEIVERKEE